MSSINCVIIYSKKNSNNSNHYNHIIQDLELSMKLSEQTRHFIEIISEWFEKEQRSDLKQLLQNFVQKEEDELQENNFKQIKKLAEESSDINYQYLLAIC